MNSKCWHPVFIGIGSNLDNPYKQVTQALAELDKLDQSALVLWSRHYISEPVGPAGQADYVNAVAGLLTRLAPLELLDQLQAIELAHGRERSGERWSARTLDLDILVYADQEIRSERLIVPHRELHKRSFVLGPWMDIAPHFEVVGQGSIARLAHGVDLGTLRCIDSSPDLSVAESESST